MYTITFTMRLENCAYKIHHIKILNLVLIPSTSMLQQIKQQWVSIHCFSRSKQSNVLCMNTSVAQKCWSLLCTPMSAPITIVVTTLTTHNINTLMVHHIQTKKLTHLQQCNNPNPKYKKPKHLYNKENCKAKLYYRISNHQKWFEVIKDGIISYNKYPELCSHMNWFEMN